MSRRTRWLIKSCGSGAIFVLAGLVFLLFSSISLAMITIGCGLCLIVGAQTQRYVYRQGFYAGVVDFSRSVLTGTLPALDHQPEPWDDVPDLLTLNVDDLTEH